MASPITVEALLVNLDMLMEVLTDTSYAIDRLPYDDDKLNILYIRMNDMLVNLPHIKTHVREHV